MSAAIEIPAGAYVVGIWHFEMPPRLSEFGEGGNYIAILLREENATHWNVLYRFRHYRDRETVWQSKDSFHTYLMKVDGKLSEAEVQRKTDGVVQIAAAIAGEMVDYTEVRGDGELAFTRLQNLPWFHAKAEVAS